MSPLILWLVRIGAVALAALSGAWLANTTPTWQEDSAREELPYRWGYFGYGHYSETLSTFGCIASLFNFLGSGCQGSWLIGVLRAAIAIGAIICAYTGWPQTEDAYGQSGSRLAEDFMLLFEPATWILLGSLAGGYVAGIVLRKQPY